MVLVIQILATIMFGFFAYIGFYHAFTIYKPGDDIFDHFVYDFIVVLAIVGSAVLWACKKLFPKHVYIKAFKATAFVTGLLMVSVIPAIWLMF